MEAPRDIRLNLSLSEEAMDKLRGLARADHRTVGNYVWRVVMSHIDNCSPPETSPEDARSDAA